MFMCVYVCELIRVYVYMYVHAEIKTGSVPKTSQFSCAKKEVRGEDCMNHIHSLRIKTGYSSLGREISGSRSLQICSVSGLSSCIQKYLVFFFLLSLCFVSHN